MLVWISNETTLVITCDSSIRLEDVLEKDESGKVVGLKLKERAGEYSSGRRGGAGEWELMRCGGAVWIANHQQYADWIYLWTFFYASSLAGAVVITLKASLQYIPSVSLRRRDRSARFGNALLQLVDRR